MNNDVNCVLIGLSFRKRKKIKCGVKVKECINVNLENYWEKMMINIVNNFLVNLVKF